MDELHNKDTTYHELSKSIYDVVPAEKKIEIKLVIM